MNYSIKIIRHLVLRTPLYILLILLSVFIKSYAAGNTGKINKAIFLLYSGELRESTALFDETGSSPFDSLASYLYKSLAYESVNDEYRTTMYDSLLFRNAENAVNLGETLASSDKSSGSIYLYLGGAYGVRGMRKAMLGDTWGGIKDGRKAHQLLHRAVELDTTLYDTYYGLGMYHYWKSRKAHLFIRFLGWLFRIKDEREQGIRELHTAMEKGSYAKFPAMRALFRIYTEEKRYDELISLINEYKKTFPEDLYYKWFLGMAYIHDKDWQTALDLYKEMENRLQSVPYRGIEADVECRYYTALCLYNLGEKKEAENLCRKILAEKNNVNRNIFIFEDFIDGAERLLSEINTQ